MKKSIASIFLIIGVLVIIMGACLIGLQGKEPETSLASSTVDKEPKFLASLSFPTSHGNDVVLTFTNNGQSDITVSEQAYYMDNIGSAGSWKCQGEKTLIQPGQTRALLFRMENPVEHGDHSILAFYFQHGGQWYLGKTGPINGIEYYREHD